LSNLEDMPVSSVIILDALIFLAVTPFLLLSVEGLANNSAILAYLLLVAGVGVRFVEMKNLLNIDKQKEMLIKILCLAVLPTAGMAGAFELMKVNPGAGQIFFALMILTTVVLLAFLYYYQMRRIQINGNRDENEF
jgi:O-antigen/teichoic acid export membrane protein